MGSMVNRMRTLIMIFATQPFEATRIFDYDGDPLELTINTNLVANDNYYTIKDSDGKYCHAT